MDRSGGFGRFTGIHSWEVGPWVLPFYHVGGEVAVLAQRFPSGYNFGWARADRRLYDREEEGSVTC